MNFMFSDTKRLLEFTASLRDENSIDLEKKMNAYLIRETHCESSFFLLDPEPLNKDESNSSDLVYWALRVLGEQEVGSPSNPIKLVFPQKALCDKSDVPSEILSQISRFVSSSLTSFLSLYLVTSKHSCRICLINKIGKNVFDTLRDTSLIKEAFHIFYNTWSAKRELEEEKRLKEQCQSLLLVAKNLFTHLDDVSLLLRQIMAEARALTQAERCSLFLLDSKNNELIAKVFDGDIPEKALNLKNGYEVRIPVHEGIAGQVAQSGTMINISDAQNHPNFYDRVDKNTGFKTKNILCFPIKNNNNIVIGVAELCNKMTGCHFTRFDEEIASAFSAYCGISILHSLMYKKVADAQHRSKLSNELMMYHMKVSETDVNKLANINLVNSLLDLHPDFTSFSFIPRLLDSSSSESALLNMFYKSTLMYRWKIPRDVLCRFILMVKRGYRTPPYHNWSHAFSVSHFGFLLLLNCKLMERNMLTDLECLAFLVACMCHDLDHRGTNNSFQVTSNSVLAALYSSEGSVMERHHFSQTMCILNTEGCNILENLNDTDYRQVLDVLRDIILATDLAHHFRIASELRTMIHEGYDSRNSYHHHLLTSLLISAADLSDQSKSWSNSKNIAELIYSEFFSQGDLEKAMGNSPVEMMDRERACIPSLQIHFLDDIALPIYKCLYQLFPETKSSYDAVMLNRKCWNEANNVLKKRNRKVKIKNIFKDKEIEENVLRILSKENCT